MDRMFSLFPLFLYDIREQEDAEMKWFIASDIHGSAYWCRKMIKAFEKEEADRILLLGDVLYHGPRNDLPEEYAPKKVVEILKPYKDIILGVRGNCEAEIDEVVLGFPLMADYTILVLDDLFVFATHGHHYNKNSLPQVRKGSILLHGHTHVPCFEEGDIPVYNPGSVSIPKDGSPHGYMIYEDRTFTWKDLDGTVYHQVTK